MVPNWSDVSSVNSSNKGKRKAERALENEVRKWKSLEDDSKRQKRWKEQEEERRVEDYVREVELHIGTNENQDGNDGSSMMSAIKMGMINRRKKHMEEIEKKKKTPMAIIQKKQANPESAQEEEEIMPNYLCTLSGEAVVLDGSKNSFSKKHQQSEKKEKILCIQSQSEFTSFAILLSQPLFMSTSSPTVSPSSSSNNHVIYYYEATIHSVGLTQIGWALSSSSSGEEANVEEVEFNPNSDVGDGVGDDSYSYGFDASRSLIFHDGKEITYGDGSGSNEVENKAKSSTTSANAGWNAGDTLGCIYDSTNGTISYTLNGKHLGIAFGITSHINNKTKEEKSNDDKKSKHMFLFPALSLNHGVIVTVNVGPNFDYIPSAGSSDLDHTDKVEKTKVVGICDLIGDDSNGKKASANYEKKSSVENSGRDKKKEETKEVVDVDQNAKEKSATSSKILNAPSNPSPKKPNQQQEEKQTPKEEQTPFVWSDYDNASQLESLGIDRLKSILFGMGVKCGGSLQERANRLFSLKGLEREDYPQKVRGKNFVV
mmetsp:Transcript_15496/g.22916  ORF Transcript_15496/g.22916 Transcript_15496/m.22916 type:complete len:543 (+) Transcript_15496:57-1685(+)